VARLAPLPIRFTSRRIVNKSYNSIKKAPKFVKFRRFLGFFGDFDPPPHHRICKLTPSPPSAATPRQAHKGLATPLKEGNLKISFLKFTFTTQNGEHAMRQLIVRAGSACPLFAKLAALVLALAFTFGCSSDDNPSNNQPNINSGSEISSPSGGGSGSGNGDGSSSPSSNGNGSGGSSSSSGGSNGSSSSSSGSIGSSSSSNGNTGFSSSSLGQSSSAVLKECDAIFNPDNKFCYDGNVYDKCGGKVYSPASEICQYGQVTTAKCNNGDSYNPLTQSCCGSIAILSNSTTERCTNGVAEAKCGSIWYKQTTQFCYNDIVYDKCNGINNYNPSTQGCVNGKIVETKCGSGWYDQATHFCVDNSIYAKCDGMVYPPATHICQNGVATPAKCNGESYNPLTQFCSNGTVKTYGSVTYQSQTYKTTVIGTQTWMAENLNYNATGSKCYDNNEANCAIYGRLYNWATAMKLSANCNTSTCSSQITTKHQGICPNDWHIPNDAEWTTLINFVGSNAETKLKATSGWNDHGSSNGTNDYGFAALPGGSGYSNNGSFYYDAFSAWWSASEYNGANAYCSDRISCDPSSFRGFISKNILFSVRCVKD